MQQIVDHACTMMSTADIIREVKGQLSSSLGRLEQAILKYEQRHALKKEALVEELDGYLCQLRGMLGEEQK